MASLDQPSRPGSSPARPAGTPRRGTCSTATAWNRFDSFSPPGPTISGRCAYAGGSRPERLDQLELPRRRRHQVLAADHVGHPHARRRRPRPPAGRSATPLRPKDDEVLEVDARERGSAADQVVHGDVASRHREPDRGRAALALERLPLLVGEAPAAAVVAGRLAALQRRPAPVLQLLGRAVAAVGAALLQQPAGDLGEALRRPPSGGTARAVRRPRRPRPSPARASAASAIRMSMASSVDRGRVGVLDPKDERPAVVAGEQPVEQRRPGVARRAGSPWATARCGTGRRSRLPRAPSRRR